MQLTLSSRPAKHISKGNGVFATVLRSCRPGICYLGLSLLLLLADVARQPAGIICVAVLAGLLAHGASSFDEQLKGRRRWRLALALAWGGLLAGILLHDNLRAQWWANDDREIATFVGPGGSLSLSDLIGKIRHHPEIGSPPMNWPRFRPVYFTIRLTECYLWGKTPILWYATLMACFTLVLAFSWTLLWRWVGSLGACLILLQFLTYSFWGEIWCAIGPAEGFAACGLVLWLTGMEAVCRPLLPLRQQAGICSQQPALGFVSPGKALLGWVQICLGGLLAFGCKENFLVVVPLTCLIAGWLAWHRRLGWIGLSGTLLVIGTGLTVAAVVFQSVQNKGSDIYCQPVASGGRLWLMTGLPAALLHTWEFSFLLPLALGACAIWALAWRHGQAGRLTPLLRRSSLGFAALLMVAASQFFVYNGHWPAGCRYDFPGLLALPIMAFLLAWLILAMLKQLDWPGRPILRLCWLTALAVVILNRGFPLFEAGQLNVARTERFTEGLNRVIAQARIDPSRAICFRWHSLPFNYEPILSVREFLRSEGVDNPLFLSLDFAKETDAERDDSPQRAWLTSELKRISEKGDEDFRPIDGLPRSFLEVELTGAFIVSSH